MAVAGVNLKNGNFYITYSDIVVPGGGHPLEIVRTYNSKSTEKGWFGFGWGSDYETFLTVSADGSVVVHENGAGALTRFVPKTAVDGKAAATKIIAAMRKKTPINEKVANDLVKKLSEDAELRQAYARKFGVKATLASGTQLFSNTRGLQTLNKIKKGFQRLYNDGKVETFNESGKLIQIKDKNGYKVDVAYKAGFVKTIKDSQAKQLFFEWFPDGKVKAIFSVGDKKTSYKYHGEDLIDSTDVSGNKYAYGYDGNHNMTSISYSDKSKMKITYTPQTQFVASVTNRNGESTGYKYEANKKNPEFHYWTKVTKTAPSGKKVENRYEYEIKTRPDGSQYTYRILTVINNLKTETIYSECCSLPLKIARGKHVTNFEYNDKGLLVKKNSTKGDFVQLDYHKKYNKITRVKNNKGWTEFKYDKGGNLSKAWNNKGKSVLLIYDRRGRITKMVDKNTKSNKQRTLTFKYNAMGKPVEISMSKVGKIHVAYDNYGEIKKVESKAGHKMALQVTQAFQSLLSIVKPAGVNLNM
ncbi:MAG: RHS repeat protein [Halobacteriovoraceae bacterium]|nr:RHS repeat protein [Halobacteriovoraceae bacterium]